MKKTFLFSIYIVGICILCACGSAKNGAVVIRPSEELPLSSPAASPTEASSLAPLSELTFPDGSVHPVDEASLSLPDVTSKDIPTLLGCLKQMPGLIYIDLGKNAGAISPGGDSSEDPVLRDLSWEDIKAVQDACPQAAVNYSFTLWGKSFSTLDTKMDLNHIAMDDEGAAVKEVLPCMKNLTYLDMDSCEVSSESMAEIRDAYPDVNVVWRIWFAAGQFTMRTDSERLWCANFYQHMTDEYTQELKYLTHLKYLDLGHNLELHDWNFMRYMTELEVCIITASGWDTLDMLENCTKLEFLEIVPYAHIELDLHPLAGMQDLEHLNICGMGQTEGWEVLLGMPKLKRLWIGTHTAYFFPEGAMDQILAAHPDTDILYKVDGAATGSWRLNPDGTVPERYKLLREQFDYDHWPQVAPYPYNDPKYNPPW